MTAKRYVLSFLSFSHFEFFTDYISKFPELVAIPSMVSRCLPFSQCDMLVSSFDGYHDDQNVKTFQDLGYRLTFKFYSRLRIGR